MKQESKSLKSRLKESIKHNPIYTSAIRPLRVKLNRLRESMLNDEDYFLRRHKKIFGYTPDFRNPQTFNEKIIHRILFDRSPVYTALADKLKARIYIAATLYPLYENAIRGGAECKDSSPDLQTNPDSSAHIQALAKLKLLEPSSPLFAPIDTLESTLFATNICPYLPKLYKICKSFDEIDFATLPSSFAIKTNHDGGGVVLVPNKQEFLSDQARFKAARSKIQQHLATNFYTLFREWHYKDIEPRVFIEELLGVSSSASEQTCAKTFENNDFHNKTTWQKDLDSSPKPLDSGSMSLNADSKDLATLAKPYKAPDDYKFHCFGDKVFIQVDTERFTNHTRTMFDTEWNKIDFSLCFPQPKYIPQPPNNPQLMIEIAVTLAKHCSYVRVDLYAINADIIVGELTYTHGGGTEKFTPNEWDKKLGDLWH